MTFKHIDPKDSNIMKHFEQAALKRGLIKPEPVIEKSASTNTSAKNLSLDENILKLCSELRNKGLHSKAEELETNFLTFKIANDGEKRIEEAHPESPQFGDSEYGVIENILQEHKKILEMLNKQPTGKLTNAKNIINSVKLALGEDVEIEFGDIELDDPEPEVTGVEFGDIEIDEPAETHVAVEFGDPILDRAAARVRKAAAIFKKKADNYDNRQIVVNNKLPQSSSMINFAKKEINRALGLLNSVPKHGLLLSQKSIYEKNLKQVFVYLNALSDTIQNNFDYKTFMQFMQSTHIKSMLHLLNQSRVRTGGSSLDPQDKNDPSIARYNSAVLSVISQVRGLDIFFNNLSNIYAGSMDDSLDKEITDHIISTETKQKNDLTKDARELIIEQKNYFNKLINYFASGLSGYDQEDVQYAINYIKENFISKTNNAENYYNKEIQNAKTPEELRDLNRVVRQAVLSTLIGKHEQFVKDWLPHGITGVNNG